MRSIPDLKPSLDGAFRIAFVNQEHESFFPAQASDDFESLKEQVDERFARHVKGQDIAVIINQEKMIIYDPSTMGA